MLREIIAVVLSVCVATSVAHGQARDKNIGNVFKKFGQQLKQDLQRGTEGLRRPSSKPPELASQTHAAGTCLVYSNVGAEIDRERCNRVEECDVTGICVARHIWPSGSETIVQSQNGQLRFINGSSVAAMNMYGQSCLRNKATANIFCFVKEEPTQQAAGDPPPAGTKIDPPRDVARDLLKDLFGPGQTKQAPSPSSPSLPSPSLAFGTADLPAIGWHYYAGEQKCDQYVRKVHLQLQVFDTQRAAGRLSHQEVRLDGSFGKRSPVDHVVRQIKAASVGDKIFFASDRREMSGLFEGTGQSVFNGQWLARGLERGGCDPLVLKRTENPKQIFEQLSTALTNQRASVKDAEQVASLITSAPDWMLSTDGEGRPLAGSWTSKRQFATSYSNFWRGFHQRQNQTFKNINLNTRNSYDLHADDISEAIALSEAYSGWDREHVNFAVPLEQRLADAQALLEAEAKPAMIPSLQRACERMLTGGQNGRNLNLEYVTGLPFEYWTGKHRDQFVASARNCAELYGQFQSRYRIIAREVSNMDVTRLARWQDGQWLMQKARDANALQAGLDALRQTNGFEISSAELRERQIKKAQYQRLYLPRVQEIKKRSLDLAGEEMRAYFDRQSVKTLHPKNAARACETAILKGVVRPETYSDPRTAIEKILLKECLAIAKTWGADQAIENARAHASKLKALPANFEVLRDNNWFAFDYAGFEVFNYEQQQLVIQRFEFEISAHRRAAIVDARGQIRNAVRDAVPETPSAKVLGELCRIDNSAPSDIRDYCTEQHAVLVKKTREFRCSRAIEESRVRDDQMQLRVRYAGGRVISLGNLICEGGINQPDFMVLFKQGGFIFTPNLQVKTRQGGTIADLDLRVSTPRDGRSFSKLLLDIATGENEREVQETYVLERINSIDSSHRARDFENTIGCVLRFSDC